MQLRNAALVLPLALGLACAEHPTAPSPDTRASVPGPLMQAKKGTGLILNSVTGLTLPLIGRLGDVVIDQAEITNFAIVEKGVGEIVGVEANGVLQLTGGVLGTDVVKQNFTTTVSVASSGHGQCGIVTIDLAPIDITVLDPIARVDIPAATVDAKGSGALGPLLCALGQALNPVTAALRGIVQAINALI